MSALNTNHTGAFDSGSEAYVLQHWTREHRKIASCLDELEALLADGEASSSDLKTAIGLVEPTIDAPDDFHHILERRAYRRAWFRSGRYLPASIDLDERQNALRNARERLLSKIDVLAPENTCNIEPAVRHYVACARAAIANDERNIYPLLRRYLTCGDWCELADALRAFEDVAEGLRSLTATKRVDRSQ